MRVLDVFRPPLVAIDIGTAVTRVRFGHAEVMERPSIIRETVDGETIDRPTMRSGVVADISGVASIVSGLLAKRHKVWRRRPGGVVCAPTDVTESERDALIEAVSEAGASVVAVVPEPLAAAIGSGVDVASEYASAIVDIGDGVTDFAVLRNGSIIRSDAMRIGCGSLRAAIRDWVELQRQELALADDTIERIVRAYCRTDVEEHFVTALQAWRPVILRRDDLETLLEPVIDSIAMFVDETIRNLPDALGAEVIESGLQLTGGGARLGRLVARVEEKVGLRVTVPDDPLNAVIRGASEMLRNARVLETASAGR